MNKQLLVTATLAAIFSITVEAEPFFAQMVSQDVTFQVESPNDRSINPVVVRASTAEVSFGQMQAEADGTITKVEIEDLNADGYPEIYVYVTSAGSGSYGSLIAYASNRNKSLSEIYLPSIEGDTNDQPTGGARQIQYKLESGESGWVLRKDRVLELPVWPPHYR